MKNAYKVLIPQDIGEEGKAYLLERGYTVAVGTAWDEDTLVRDIADADAVIARTAVYTRRVIEAGYRLRVIARFGVGTDNIDLEAAREKNVTVTVARNTNTVSVAEHALLLLLACARKLLPMHMGVCAGDWDIRNRIFATELSGKTLGVLGLGAIGLELAKKAYYGLSMKVLGYGGVKRRNLPDYIRQEDRPEALFCEADAVSLHIPGVQKNLHFVNAELLALMKPGAILINTARGSIVDEAALYAALKEGRLSAYGTDVFEDEPTSSKNPLLTLPTVVATPHAAGLTLEASSAMSLSAAKAVNDVLMGRQPDYPI